MAQKKKRKRDTKLCAVCRLPLIPKAEWKKGIHNVCRTIEESVGAKALKRMPLADIREVKTKIEFHRWAKRNDTKSQQEVKKPGIWIDKKKKKGQQSVRS